MIRAIPARESRLVDRIAYRDEIYDALKARTGRAGSKEPYKQITLGDMVQTSQAFGQLQSNLSFFRSAYDEVAGFKAVLDRLTGFIDAIHSADQLPTPELTPQSETQRATAVAAPRRPDAAVQLSFSLSAGRRC
jgi:hypothetical protein